MANTYLSKTLGTPTNNKKWTFSAWVKRTHIESVTTIFSAGASNTDTMSFSAAGIFNFYVNAGNSGRFATTRLFRDSTAWYHVFVSVDTTQGTASDRMKLYINGVQETSFSVVSYPSQNYDTKINSSVIHTLGGYSDGSSGEFWRGAMSHINFIDGTQYAVTDFGETDSTTGEWKIKTSPSVTYGNNGFFILKDGNTITDSSPNSNNFSLAGGTLTNTNDCPSNNFATWNLHDRWGGATAGNTDFLFNGNTYFNTTSDSSKAVVRSSIGVSSGKYYCEFKIPEIYRTWIGILNRQFFTSATNNFWTTGLSSGFFWYGNGPAVYNDNDQSSSAYGGFANNDVIMFALDMDNYAWYLGKNGTWLNSGNPESGATKTGSVTEESNFGTATLTDYGEVFFMVGDSSAAGVAQVQANFGNGYFGTTAVTTNSGNGYAGADGKSTFNYQPPTGYSALSTKGLNL